MNYVKILVDETLKGGKNMDLEELKRETEKILEEYKTEVQEENGILVGKERNNSTIYCHLNKKTNGVYIGQTMLNPKIRWGKMEKDTKNKKAFGM